MERSAAVLFLVISMAIVAFGEVEFLNSTVYKYLDDGGSASITCLVRNIPNWNTIMIKHIPKRSGISEVVANVTQSDETLLSILVSRVQMTTLKGLNSSVTLVFTTVECADEGEYVCEVTNDFGNETTTDTMNFVLYRRPTLPVLSLHYDQVEDTDRQRTEHKCFGNTGYPPGIMKLEYQTTKMEGFKILSEPSSVLRMMPNETGIGACETNQTFTFGLRMPKQWDQAVIRCSIENPLVLGNTEPLAVNKTIELVLLSTCNGTVEDVYKSNFFNCSRFIHCNNGLPYVKECPNGLIFGIIKSTGQLGSNCDHKSNVLCEKDITTTTIITTTTVAPTDKGVTFLDRRVLKYLDDGVSASITCVVQNISNWNNIVIKHVPKGLNSQKVVANVTQNDETLVSNLVSRVQLTTEKVTNISVKLIFTTVDCSDEGQYICEVTNDIDTRIINDTMDFVVYRRPTLPQLSLSIHQVENTDRYGEEHKCFGNTGYPPGIMKLEYLTKGMKQFEDLSELSSVFRMSSNESIMGACKTNKTYTFGLRMSQEWNQAVIRCSIENQSVLGDKEPLAVNGTIELVSLSTCNGTVGDIYRSHLYNCSRFIHCYNGQPNIGECQTGLFGILKSTGKLGSNCDSANNVICENDITIIQCKDKSSFIGSAQVIIDCNVSSSANQNFTVYRKNQRLAFVDGTGKVTNEGVTDIFVTFDSNASPKILHIRISNVKCEDQGNYTITPSNGFSATVTLKVKEKPKGGSPTLKIPLKVVEDEEWHPITCSGNVGYPKGRLKFEIKMPDIDTFTHVKENSSSYRQENCTFNAEISLTLNRGMDMNDSLIRCFTENNQTYEEGDASIRSTEKRLYIIPKTVCANATLNEYRNHPYECNRYITCQEGNTVVHSCPTNRYFDISKTSCVDATDQCSSNTVITTSTMPSQTTAKSPAIITTIPPTRSSESPSVFKNAVILSTVPVVAVIVVVILIVILIIIKRRKIKNSRENDEYHDFRMDPYASTSDTVGSKAYASILTQSKTDRYRPFRPIDLSNFSQIVKEMHKENNKKFAKDFEDLIFLSPKDQCKTAKLHRNRRKNRNDSVLPFDRSRVKFTEDEQNYINASHVQNFRNKLNHDFIVTQHPLSNTFEDFWTMIWEQNVSVIVSLTPQIDKNQLSYDNYFPSEAQSSKQYGSINVQMVTKCFIQKTKLSTIKIMKGKKARIIKHFKSFEWNDEYDHSMQTDIVQLIDAVKSNINQSDELGPTVVHCGFGTGRSGVYIALYHLVNCIDDSNVDIFDLVLTMRESRMHLIENECQYIFIHDCFLHMINEKKTKHINTLDPSTVDSSGYLEAFRAKTDSNDFPDQEKGDSCGYIDVISIKDTEHNGFLDQKTRDSCEYMHVL